MKKDYKFEIVFPPGVFYLAIALAVVYDMQLMLITVGLLTVLFTILRSIGWLK